jgi:hypothetical protein
LRAGRQRTAQPGPEPLAALLGLADRLPGPWQTSSSNIAMQPVVVRAADVEWIVHLHAYAVRMHLTGSRRVEVTVGLTISTDRLPGGRAGRARAARWQRGLAKRLAAAGYKGVWGSSPGGPFAHFHRTVRNVAAVPAAIRKLQRVPF